LGSNANWYIRGYILFISRGVYAVSRQQHDAYVVEEFDRAAARYDDSRLVQSYQRRVQALVVDRLNIKRGMKVLDLGCGTGWATLEIASRLEGTGKVVGLDLSEAMIEQARQKQPAFRYDNVEFVQESASSLSYDSCFDCVVSTNAFHHFADKEQVFANVWQSLKRGGTFVIQDFSRDFFLMRFVDLMGKFGEKAHVGTTTSGELAELFSIPGFIDVQVEAIKLNWFWGIMIGRGMKPGYRPGCSLEHEFNLVYLILNRR
jgi:demethylmenaquinone methyltransferase/2-methoxy-6-polyprenyl-1,4-benzoquinol methylase